MARATKMSRQESLRVFDEGDGVGSDALFAAGKAQSLGGGGLD